jgi:hypothetical protein
MDLYLHHIVEQFYLGPIHLTGLPSMFEKYPPIGPVFKFPSEITLNNIKKYFR